VTDPWGLAESNVVITGASSGIGAAMAEAFLDAGAHVTAISRTPDRQATPESDRYHTIAADLSKRGETLDVIASINADGQPVDVLVNNAGGATRGPSIDYPIEDWDRIIELNVTAPFLLSRG